MWTKILLLFFVFSFLFKTDSSFDQDLGRHIKVGEIIFQTSTVPKTNLFSYTNPDFPFINTHWLFGVIAHLFNQAGILNQLLILKVVIFLFSVWLIFKIIPKEKSALLLPIAFIFLHVLRERTELRPEIFSFLFAASTFYILEKFLKQQTRLIFLLPLIQLLWINTHIYFFVGLTLQAIFIIHLGYQSLKSQIIGKNLKLLGFIFGQSILFSLINPNTLAGLLYPLNVTKNYGYSIVENQTIFLLESIGFSNPNFIFVKIAWGIIAASIIFAVSKRNFEMKNILIALFGVGLTLLNVRSLPYLVFLSLPAVLMNLPEFKFRGFVKALIILITPILILESFLYLNGDYYRYKDQSTNVGLSFVESPRKALEFVAANNLPQPIFNNFDIGSYIIFKAHPKYKVFVDGRPEAYPADFFHQIYIPIQSDYTKFKEAEKQYKFQTIIFSHTDQTPWGSNFLQNIVRDPSWSTVYIDNFMIVLLKKELQANLQTVDLNNLDPKSFKFSSHTDYLRVGYFLLRTNHLDSGSKFIQKALNIFPNSPSANALMGINLPNRIFW